MSLVRWLPPGGRSRGLGVPYGGKVETPATIAVGPDTRQAREFGSLVTGNDRPTGSVFQISELALRCVTCSL